jgi:hypothetical protein
MRQAKSNRAASYLSLASVLHTPDSESEAVVSHLSAHADHRHEYYFFARTQSRALADREWERTERLHSWSEIIFPALGAAAALLVVAEIVL